MGLDLSLTGSGCVVLDNEGKVLESGLFGYKLDRKAPTKDKIYRLIFIIKKIVAIGRKVLEDDPSELVIGIENYAFGAKGAQSNLGELQGAVKTQIYLAFNIIPSIIVASSARLKVLGKGRFSKGRKGKKEIVAAVCSCGFNTDDDNVADAFVIAECLRLKEKEDDGREEKKKRD
jgi:hypothetical protein